METDFTLSKSTLNSLLTSIPNSTIILKSLGQRTLAANIGTYSPPQRTFILFGLNVLLFAIKVTFSNFSCCKCGHVIKYMKIGCKYKCY